MFDAIGVVLKAAKKGKFSAFRVFIRDGQVVKEESITEVRHLAYAQKEAAANFSLVVTDYQRGNFEFNEPEQLDLFSEER